MKAQKIIMTILICSLVCLCTPSAGSTEETVPIETSLSQAFSVILSHQIVMPEAGASLASALTSITAATDNLKLISGLALEVTDKVVNDYGNLAFLLNDLETLAATPYASKLGKVRPDDLASAHEKMARLRDDLTSQRPQFQGLAGPLGITEYTTMLDNNKAFLTGEKQSITTLAEVWQEITALMEKAEHPWSVQYHELLLKVNADLDGNYQNILTKEELSFAKTFSRVKTSYYMLSDR